MDANYWIGEMGRLYERSSEAINLDQSHAIEPLSQEFNEALEELKREFPENEIVSRTESVDAYTEGHSSSSGRTVSFSPSRVRNQALHEIRSRCEKMANALNHELPEGDVEPRKADQMVMVSVEQESSQDVNQDVSVESIMQLVEMDPQVQGNRDEVKAIIQKFEEELENDSTDETRLRQFIEEAKQYSTSVAAKMAMRALQAGAVGVLALS